MTGEMGFINQDTGIDSNGDSHPIHLAIAKAVKGDLRPFDVYQGPYIRTAAGDLWLVPADTDDFDGYEGRIYNDQTEALSFCFDYNDVKSAVIAAQSVI